MNTRLWRFAAAAGVAAVTASAARAQSLFMRSEPAHVDENGKPDPLAALRASSLVFIEAPRPRTYAVHDKVTIIIDEVSKQTSQQTLDSKKDYNLKDVLAAFPDLSALVNNGTLVSGMGNAVALQVDSSNKFKGQGTYDRSDRFTAKITATVIDVKPNGVLVVEARKTKVTDDESQTIVLSGECRQEDVTTSNTVLSSQIADLTLVTKNEGQVKDTSTKGFIPRILEAIFNF